MLTIWIRPIKQRFWQWQYELTRPTLVVDQASLTTEVILPKSDSSQAISQSEPPTKAKQEIPRALNYQVPFTSQAPKTNWDTRHEEYCEEASALMVGRYFNGREINGPDDAETGLFELEQWQLQHFGFFESTTAEQTARMIADVYNLNATVEGNVMDQSIKQVLSDGGLVILPTAGQKLGNPYFKQPGPVYHMLVVKGFTNNNRFITNDPGTRRGADYIYKSSTLLGAIGDYNNNDPVHGDKVMIVVMSN